jgi:hypothetical protein
MVVEDRRGDVAQGRQLADHVEADARVQLDHGTLVGLERSGLREQVRRQGEVADRPHERRAHQDVALALVEVELPRERDRVDRQLRGLGVRQRVAGGDRLGQHPNGAAVDLAELLAEVGVVHRGSGVVAEAEEHVVVDLAEALRAVGADDHPGEAVVQVKRDGDERLDLVVGGGSICVIGHRRLVLAEDLVAGEHRAREALGDGAALSVVLEAPSHHEVEIAVAVGVLAGEEQPLLGADELDRGL